MVKLSFDGPGSYLVTTKNQIKSEFMEMFSLEITDAKDGPNVGNNTYTISIKDQSELMGFLNSLYNQHHTILKVEHLPKK